MEDYPARAEIEKKLSLLLDALPLEAGLTKEIRELINLLGINFVTELATKYLKAADSRKKSLGCKIAMYVDPEKNVALILPLLSEEPHWLVRWQIINSITGTKIFLEDGNLGERIIQVLLEDPSPDVRIEAAEALGYCKITTNVIAALRYARDHDFESDGLGYVLSDIAEDALERIKQRQSINED